MSGAITLWFFLSLAAVLHAGEIVVVANPNAPVESLSRDEVSHLFLSKNPHFANGQKALPVELARPEIKRLFYEHFSGKTLSQLRAYWVAQMFTGKGRPPKQFASAEELIRHVVDNPYAIAYMAAEHVDGRLKVVYRMD